MRRDTKPQSVLAIGLLLFSVFAVGGLLWLSGARPGAAWVQPLESSSILASMSEITAERLVEGVKCGYVDGVRLDANGGVMIWGWAFDPRFDRPAQAVMVSMNGRPLRELARVDLPRSDIRRLAAKPGLEASGWGLRLPTSVLKPGKHVFVAHARFDDGRLCKLRKGGRNWIRVESQRNDS